MKKKIGLVIQGPLLSIGRAGNNLHMSPEELKRTGGVVHFDCRDNIRNIISEFGHLFDKIIVSTWDNEVEPGDSWEGATLVSQPDPGGIKQEGHYKDNNKFRQFLSTIKGLEELEKSGMEYAVKARTDQHMDLGLMVSSYFKEVETRDESKAIGATVVHPPSFLLHDLYFVANTGVLKKFCESILAYDRFEFISSVHREMVLKHACHEYRQKIGVPDWAYFPKNPPDGVSGETRKVFDYMFENVYFNLDPGIFKKTLWRGAYYEEDHVTRLVEGLGRIRRYNLPALITIDWERYFYFRMQTSGQKISLLDKAVVQVSKLGWWLWNMIRKAGRSVRSMVR